MNFEDIRDFVRNNQKTCLCGNPLENNPIISYDHDGGIDLDGYEKKQWVYFACRRCGYDYAANKIVGLR